MASFHYKINLPRIPNQPRQLSVLTMPDNLGKFLQIFLQLPIYSEVM